MIIVLNNDLEYYYRIDYLVYGSVDEWGYSKGRGTLKLRLFRYRVLKHTPKGVWLDMGHPDLNKFVRTNARKRWACPTVLEAHKSFIARKSSQIRILKSQLYNVDRALGIAKNLVINKNTEIIEPSWCDSKVLN